LEELDLKNKELAVLKDTLDTSRADSKVLRVEMDKLHLAMSEMVARTLLLAAKGDAKMWKDDAEAKDVEMVSLQKSHVELKDAANALRKEVDDLQSQLVVMTPQAALLVAQEAESTAKTVCEGQVYMYVYIYIYAYIYVCIHIYI